MSLSACVSIVFVGVSSQCYQGCDFIMKWQTGEPNSQTIIQCEAKCTGNAWAAELKDPIPTCKNGCAKGLDICPEGNLCSGTGRTPYCASPKVVNTDPTTNTKQGFDCVDKSTVPKNAIPDRNDPNAVGAAAPMHWSPLVALVATAAAMFAL